jgi:hypothetical protein
MVWILGRTYSTGTPEDYAAVHKLQAKYQLYPLSAGPGYKAPPGKVDASIDEKTAVREQVDAMDAEKFFALAAELMGPNPPTKEDAPMVKRMAKIGFAPGRPFDTSPLSGPAAQAVQSSPREGQEQIKAMLTHGAVEFVNGWMVTLKTGTYGTDYGQRAIVTAIGLGANKPQQAIYPFAEKDSAGKPFDGSQAYTIHFPVGQMPPAKAFWSITMYTPDFFFFPNPLKRYTVSSRTSFHKNDDGSVDVYVANEKPADAFLQSNWLPAPKGGFVLMMRLYWPNENSPSILDGTWKPPAVTTVSEGARVGRRPPPRR